MPLLSVLDQSPIPEGRVAGDALHNSIDLARLADDLGYHRYWLAEHHGTPGLACNAPEVLIGPVALATDRIRVGSGGIMLPHYSPFKVAESFAMLAGLAPGRVDLGVGRAPGTDGSTAFALQRDRTRRSPDDFTDQLDELLGHVAGDLPATHPFARLAGRAVSDAEPWLLGSSPQSAIWAAERGLPYCFADFINRGGADVSAMYRDQFTPTAAHPTPHVAVAVWTIAADTTEEAHDLAASSRMMLDLLHRGRLIAVPTVERAKAYLAELPDDPLAVSGSRRLVLGDPETVRAGLEAVAAEYGADEIFAVNILHDHAARRRSYELLARVMLPAPDGAARSRVRSPVLA